MNLEELLRRARRNAMALRRATGWTGTSTFVGEHATNARSRGLAFEEIRPYQPGDDVREIDWKATARLSAPMVKQFAAERGRVVWILLDESASMRFGDPVSKSQTALEAVATLLLVSSVVGDRVGVLAFGARRLVVEPASGGHHAYAILRRLVDPPTDASAWEFGSASVLMRRAVRRRANVFLIGDFLGRNGLDDGLGWLGRRHDCLALRIVDRVERVLPEAGLVRFVDAESGARRTIDASKRFCRAYAARQARFSAELRQRFASHGIRLVEADTDQPLVKSLTKLFS